MAKERIISGQTTDEAEERFNFSLRPTSLSEYVGQPKLIEKLSITLQAVKQRSEANQALEFSRVLFRKYIRAKFYDRVPGLKVEQHAHDDRVGLDHGENSELLGAENPSHHDQGNQTEYRAPRVTGQQDSGISNQSRERVLDLHFAASRLRIAS